MQLETSQLTSGSDVLRTGSGKRRYDLRRTWLDRLPAIVVMAGFTVAVFLSESEDWELWALFVIAFVVLSEWVVWPRANYIIIHPQYVDTSQLGWGSKMRKRRRHRIRYQDVISVSGDEFTGKLKISFKPSGGLGRRLGIQTWWVDAVLKNPSEFLDLRDAIELGRETVHKPGQASFA
jgi:hypothetical protein